MGIPLKHGYVCIFTQASKQDREVTDGTTPYGARGAVFFIRQAHGALWYNNLRTHHLTFIT